MEGTTKPAPAERVDRIDDSGRITEHAVSPETGKTLCGLEIYNRQKPCGNRKCMRCERIERARGAKGGEA